MARQDQFEGLAAFVTVAEEGGFSAAAVRLGISPSAVSQSVRNLESKLGFPLFNRTTRSVSLTELGQRYFDRVAPCLSELSQAGEELRDEADRPSGHLRLNVPRAGYLTLLQPILHDFMEAYPEITIEVAINNALVDIVEQGFDAGIRPGNHLAQDMIAVRIGPDIAAYLIASPDYLARHGMPQNPRDLFHHNCIGFRHVTSGQIERWEFEKDGDAFDLSLPAKLIVNDSEVLVQSVLDGLGIGYMINGYIERFLDDGRLVRVLSDWSPRFDSYFLYYPDRKRVPGKLRVLIDFLRKRRMVTGNAKTFVAL